MARTACLHAPHRWCSIATMRRLLLVTATACLLLATVAAVPSAGAGTTGVATQRAGWAAFEGEGPPGGGPIWPELFYETRRSTLADGRNVDVQILSLAAGAALEIRPTLAFGTVRGVLPVAAQSGDPLAGAVAAVNGGFWLREPYGEPNGLFSIGGRLVSDAETQGAGPRGTVGWTADGRILVDRVDSREVLTLADGTALPVDGINRGHREYDEMFADGVDSLLAYTADYGGVVPLRQPEQPPPPAPAAPPGNPPPPIPGDPEPEPAPEPAPVDLAAVRIAVPQWPAAGASVGTVVGVSRDVEASFTPGPGEVLLAATGSPARALDPVEVGDVVSVSTTLLPLAAERTADWAGVVRALAGGPMVVKDGRPTDPADWVNEGFEPHVHSDVRAPRTAIGVTADGGTFMVTADGRRPGITHGFTIGELADYMVALGAVEALSLDGGGSSQMVVDGVLRNVPCCDSSIRAVADSLQVVHAYAFSDRVRRLRGGGRVETAAEIARTAYAGGTGTAVLASADRFPDALAGGPLAAALGAPLLLTGTTTVPAVTMAAMTDLGVSQVVLLGGEAVISPQAAGQLTAAGFSVSRVAGDSRYDTAARIAAATGAHQRAFLAPAGTFADALIAAGPGGQLRMPILLSDGAALHPAARESLAGLAEVVVVDADDQLSDGLLDELAGLVPVVTTFRGGGRYQVAAQVNDWLAAQLPQQPGVVVARGDDFPDALAGGPLAARLGVPLMLVPAGSIDGTPGSAAWFAAPDRALTHAVILGGVAAVPSYHQWQLDQLTAPPTPQPVQPSD